MQSTKWLSLHISYNWRRKKSLIISAWTEKHSSVALIAISSTRAPLLDPSTISELHRSLGFVSSATSAAFFFCFFFSLNKSMNGTK